MKLAVFFAVFVPAFSQTPVLSYHNNTYRTGWYEHETALTLTSVNSASFGKLFFMPADGKVDAEPLYVPKLTIGGKSHNVVFVATENDTVYAYDADKAGSPLWQKTMLKSGEVASDSRGCGQIRPTIGVTGTPAIDLAVGPHGTMYLIAMSKDGSGAYHQRLHALDIVTGGEQFGGPAEISGSYPGSGDNSSGGKVIFDPAQYKARPGLLINGVSVVITWSSHCDFRPYTGFVMSYNKNTLKQIDVFNFTPNGEEGCVWQSGAAPARDDQGNIYFLAANGTFDTTLTSRGFPASGDYGNAFIQLTTHDGQFAVQDYFTMSNTVSESNSDQDLGSGGAMVLPALNDASGKPRLLAVGAGKDKKIYVVDRSNMGKFNSSKNNIYQELTGLNGGVYGAPAYFASRIYFGGVNDSIRGFSFENGKFVPYGQTSHVFPYPGASPSISSNNSDNPILWAVEGTSPSVLWAFNARDLSQVLYSSNQSGSDDQFGDGNKFITPMIANGKVYAASATGVGVFGLK